MEQTPRKHRDHLTGEHYLADAGQLAFLLVFLAVWALDAFVFHLAILFPGYLPWFLRIPLGLSVMALAFLLAAKGMSVIFKSEPARHEVIRKGVFSRVRHPIYLAEILLYLGFLVISPSLAAAAVLLATVVFLHFISRFEEKLLLRRFGAEYAQYMKDVPMWVPRLGKKRISRPAS